MDGKTVTLNFEAAQRRSAGAKVWQCIDHLFDILPGALLFAVLASDPAHLVISVSEWPSISLR